MIPRPLNKTIDLALATALALTAPLAAFSQALTLSTETTAVVRPTPDNSEHLSAGSREFTIRRPTEKTRADVAGSKADVPRPTASQDKRSPRSKWTFAVAPYVYLTGVHGTVGALGRSTTLDLSLGKVMKHFDSGLMGTFEASNDKVVIFNDVIWTALSETRETPGDLYSRIKVSSSNFIWNPGAGYRVYAAGTSAFDLVGGIRITTVRNSIDAVGGKLPGFDVSSRKTWAAPVAGGHGRVDVSPKFYLSTVFDIGAGFGTHVTGQFYGGGGYRLRPKVALVGGYRYLKINYDDNNGFLYNQSMNGIVVGGKFTF